MIYCEECRTLINSDDDPECFVQIEERTNDRLAVADYIWCNACRKAHAQMLIAKGLSDLWRNIGAAK